MSKKIFQSTIIIGDKCINGGQQRPQVLLLAAAPMAVPSEEEYLKKYSSGILLTTSGSEPHTDLPQILSEGSVHSISLSPR